MNFVVSDVKSQRKDYPNMLDPKIAERVNARLLTVDQYNVLARKIIGKFAPRHVKSSMLASEDAIDFVAHKIMIGDWAYDDEISKLNTYRGYCGKRAIQDFINKLSEQRHVTFAECTEQGRSLCDAKTPQPDDSLMSAEEIRATKKQLNRYMNMSGLNNTQKTCIKLFHFRNCSMKEIGRRLNMTREGVRVAIDDAIRKMQSAAGDE